MFIFTPKRPYLSRLSASSWLTGARFGVENRQKALPLLLAFNVGIGAITFQPANAGESNSSAPFVIPQRTPFVIPDSKPFVIPERKPLDFLVPEKNSAGTAKETQASTKEESATANEQPVKAPKRKKQKKSDANESAEASASTSAGAAATSSASQTSPSAAMAAPASSAPHSSSYDTSNSSSSASAVSGSAVSGSAASNSAATTSVTSASAAPVSESTSSGSAPKRFMLQGKTEVVDYQLNDLASYKQGMAQLEKRNYAQAEILFRAAAAKLDDGYEKYRAECNFFEAKCLMMQGKADQAVSLLKSAIALFDLHDQRNAYKLTAEKMLADLVSGKAQMGQYMLQGRANQLHARTNVDQDITLYSRLAADDSDPVLLKCDKEAIPQTIKECFAEMTCLETAEIGSNSFNAVGRWQPLLVKGEPAAIEFNAKPPVINVKVNGQMKEVAVNLPMVNELRRILLATDGEKIAAIDVDNADTWLLLMDTAPDGTVGRMRWALLRHQKQKSATWGVAKGTFKPQPQATGNAWGARPDNGFNAVRNINDGQFNRNRMRNRF